jgi:hypothetical protein
VSQKVQYVDGERIGAAKSSVLSSKALVLFEHSPNKARGRLFSLGSPWRADPRSSPASRVLAAGFEETDVRDALGVAPGSSIAASPMGRD